MTTTRASSRIAGRLRHVGAVALGVVLLAGALPAAAHDNGWGYHHHRHHNYSPYRDYRPGVYGYYPAPVYVQPPPVYVQPPPVVYYPPPRYVPPPPPGLTLQLLFR